MPLAGSFFAIYRSSAKTAYSARISAAARVSESSLSKLKVSLNHLLSNVTIL